MDEIDDAIDAEIQRELDAISLSSLDLEDLSVDPDETSEQDPDERQVTTPDCPSTVLFLEKSSERNKAAQGILKEAEDLLSQCNNDRISEALSEETEDAQNQAEHIEFIMSSTALEKEGKELVSTKSSEEIEEENSIKLEELEERFKVDAEKENLQLEQERVAGEEKIIHWMDQEERMQRNIKVMMDKEEYWEKTYHQVAQNELTEKENDLEKEFLESQKRILEMQEEQEKILRDLLREKEELDTKKRKDATMCIQSVFRGFSVRKKFGAEVQNRIAEMKERKRQERILVLETKRIEEEARKRAKEEKKQLKQKEQMKREKERKKPPPAIFSSHKTFSDTTAEKDNAEQSNEIPENASAEDMIKNIRTPQLPSPDAMLKAKQIAIKETQDESEVQTVRTELTDDKNGSSDEIEGLVLRENSKATASTIGDIGIHHVEASGDTDRFDGGIGASTDGISLKNDSEIALNNDASKLKSPIGSETMEQHHAKQNLESSKEKIEIESKEELLKEAPQPESRDDALDGDIDVATANTETIPHDKNQTVFETLDDVLMKNYHSSSKTSKGEINKDPVTEQVQTSTTQDMKKNSNENQTTYDSALPDAEPLSRVTHQGERLDIFADNQDQKNVSQPEMESSSEAVEHCQPLDNADVESDNGVPDDSHTAFVNHDMNQSNDGSKANSIDQEMELTFSVREESENASSDIFPELTPQNLMSATDVETFEEDQTISDDPKHSNQLSDREVTDTITYQKSSPTQNDEANLITDGQNNLEKNSHNGDEFDLCQDDYTEVNSQLQNNKPYHKPVDDSMAEIPPQDCRNLKERKQNLSNCVENSASYAVKIQQQRQSWLETFLTKSKQKETNKSSPEISRRRRLIRISSVAKRLEPFSQNEILNGAYDSPECRVDKMASCIEETKCLVLYGIASGRNLTSVTSCPYLTHLTVQNCGLVSLENLQSCSALKYISVPNNAINMVSCGGMTRLEYLDISHNRLTSVHGLEGCFGLLFLDLSHNNITKFTGLEDAKHLSHLRISSNQLISVSGLRFCEHLLYLDVAENHLMSLDDLEACNLILSVSAAGNNLECLGEGFLRNAILLVKLDASRNSLSNFGISENTWLPMLTEIDAGINRIGVNTETEHENTTFSLSTPFLNYLDLSKNLISSAETLKSLTECKCLHKVDLTDNPMKVKTGDKSSFLHLMPEVITQKDEIELESPERAIFHESFLKFCPLYNFGKRFTNLLDEDCDIVKKLSDHIEEVKSEVKRYSLEIQRAALQWNGRKSGTVGETEVVHSPNMFLLQIEHLKKMQEMATGFRNAHENAGLLCGSKADKSIVGASKIDQERLCSPTKPSTNKPTAQRSFAKRGSSRTINEATTAYQLDQCRLPSNRPNLIEDPETVKSTTPGNESDFTAYTSVTKSSRVYDKLNLRKKAGVVENFAAKKIQALWRGYHIRKRLNLIRNRRILAAIKIQAQWRGYMTRKKIKKAFEMLKQRALVIPEEDEFEDVDLDGFEFDEKSFDDQWAYKLSEFNEISHESDRSHRTISPRYVSKPSMPKTMSMPCSKPPLPPIPSRESTPLDTRLIFSDLHSQEVNSVTDSNRTKRSSKQEILTNEWGIKSSSTSDLMMRRARKMKGGRKKIQTAEQKFQRFQEKISTYQSSEPPMTKRQHPANRVDYFKTREQEFSQRNKIPSEEDEQKMNYTFEWIHTQVGSNYQARHKISPPQKSNRPHPPETRRTRSSGFLPAIPRSPSLVGIQDLEVVSVTSASTYTERSKDRLRDIAKRHNPPFKG